ncbi:hypothetical protein FACS1894202_03670 [Clostridia bacterium]|nr:hypothetical protein FACS1894202_03670 [Clostridia bacterium]
MATKTITVCDGCGKTLERIKDRFRLNLETLPYRECAEDDRTPRIIKLEFCECCAEDRLLPSLEKLAAREESQ